MRASSWALVLVLLLGADAVWAARVSAEGREVWIVRFVEPALASHVGAPLPDGELLAATSPLATGEPRLDIDAPAARAYLEHLAERREARLQAATQKLGRAIEPLFVYDAVLNGVALELDADEAARLAALPGVAAIEREFIDQLQDDVATDWTGAPQVWSGAAGVASRGEGVVVGVIDTGIHAQHPAFAAVSPLDGYSHPNLRGGFLGLCASGQATCNNKLLGIWDFTTGSSDREPNNGLDVDGHGSHVAGIAVGNPLRLERPVSGAAPLRYEIRGVAPRAHLISYKACEGGDTGCPGAWTLAAINQAVRDGVDVINYSIGGQNASPWGRSDSLAMLDARNAGILVVVAAGNRGPDGGTVTSPSDAPWVLAVANSRHGRRFANRLLLSGGATAPPGGGVLVGDALTGGLGPVPIVRDPAAPLCSQGSGDTTLPPTGVSNPWPTGRWNGQIVVCDRGVQARVAKSNNVRIAGGGGMVLVNTAAEGEGLVADAHSIPSTHLGFADGQALLGWMASGSGHRARLEGTAVAVDMNQADRLNPSSGRGPSPVLSSVLKPDLAAPGTDILAADHDSFGDASLTGTSMASPHVAGAAALLRAARPGWRADELTSALSTTARPVLRPAEGSANLTPFEQGSGRLDIARAVRAGLAFRVGPGQFAAGSADPAALNLPSLVFAQCQPDCGSLSRTVSDLVGGGRWALEVEAPVGVRLTPSLAELNLAAGASASFSLAARIEDPALYGRWVAAALRLRRVAADGVSDLRLPVLLRATVQGLPPPQTRSLAADAGAFDMPLPGLSLPLPDARFAGTALVPVSASPFSLGPDPTPESRFDNLSEGVAWRSISLPAPASGQPTRYRIEIELQSPPGTNASLLAGNGAAPASRNLICESASRCVLEIEHPGLGARAYWAMIWNRTGSGSFNLRHSVLPLVPADASATGRLVVTGPGALAAGQGGALRVAWSDPLWVEGSVRRGAVLISAAPGGTQPMAAIPWTFTRTEPLPVPRALAADVPLALRLPAGAAHDRLFIDLPEGVNRLEVVQDGAATTHLHLAHRPPLEPAAAVPAIEPAPPRGAAVAADTGGSPRKTLVVHAPAAGRWYLTPTQAGATAAELQLRARFEGQGPQLRPGAYFNPGRPGSGVFLHPAGNDWVAIWFTYRPDGSSTWYYLQAPAPAAHGQWRSPIYRAAWNGRSAHLTVVGEATFTPRGHDAATFTFTLDGETGSEAYRLLGRGCPALGPQTASGSQHWFDPRRSGSGYSVQFMAPPSVGQPYEFYAAFLYDALGEPRFLVAEGPPQPVPEGLLRLQQLTGACPLCPMPAAGAIRRDAGTLGRRLQDGRPVEFRIDALFGAGVTGAWQVTDALQPLDPLGRMADCAP